jgi:hypothetical protein
MTGWPSSWSGCTLMAGREATARRGPRARACKPSIEFWAGWLRLVQRMQRRVDRL